MATNSGKTEVAAAAIKAIGGKAVVLVHRKELMYQTAQRFIDRGLKAVGMVGDGIFDPQTITVAMIQTLDNRLAWVAETFKDNKVLIIDEAHHLSSKTAEEVFMAIPGSYRFGMSGTPLVYDVLSDMKLVAATGDIIYELTNATMINDGYSARPIINIKVVDGIEGDDNWKMEYQEAYKALIVCNEKRNVFIADYAKQQAGVVLIMVNQLDHGEALKGMIPNSIFVHGSDTTEVRQWTLETMKVTSGVYIASPIFDEGVDVPSIDCVIFAGGGISHVRLLQRIGRGLRKKAGDNILHVLDFIDDTNKHLLGHSDVRISTYISEGFETNII
jgi:superfamily II DNA or RNA helicase